jgi:hypothetical protein
MERHSNRKGLLKRKIDTDVFAVSGAPGALLSNILTAKDSGSVKLGKALGAEYLTDVEVADGQPRVANGRDYLNVFKTDKESLINSAYVWAVKLAGRLLLIGNQPGPANFLNVAGVGADQAVVNAGDNVAGTTLNDANNSRDMKKILHKFGGFKIKESLATAVGNSIEWLESKSKSLAGVDIPHQVIEKKKRPL